MAGQWGGTTKEHKETFGGDWYVYYLCCANDFRAVYICQNLQNCTI